VSVIVAPNGPLGGDRRAVEHPPHQWRLEPVDWLDEQFHVAEPFRVAFERSECR